MGGNVPQTGEKAGRSSLVQERHIGMRGRDQCKTTKLNKMRGRTWALRGGCEPMRRCSMPPAMERRRP